MSSIAGKRGSKHRLQAWREQVANFVISKLHRDVSGRLEAMGVSHQNEHGTEDGLFSIDIALLDQKLALEVDGPFHFAYNTKAPLGTAPRPPHRLEIIIKGAWKTLAGISTCSSIGSLAIAACRCDLVPEKTAREQGLEGEALPTVRFFNLMHVCSTPGSPPKTRVQVTSLPYFEWAEIETDPEAQERLLRTLLGLPDDSLHQPNGHVQPMIDIETHLPASNGDLAS